jgi:hypothetical protein
MKLALQDAAALLLRAAEAPRLGREAARDGVAEGRNAPSSFLEQSPNARETGNPSQDRLN